MQNQYYQIYLIRMEEDELHKLLRYSKIVERYFKFSGINLIISILTINLRVLNFIQINLGVFFLYYFIFTAFSICICELYSFWFFDKFSIDAERKINRSYYVYDINKKLIDDKKNNHI